MESVADSSFTSRRVAPESLLSSALFASNCETPNKIYAKERSEERIENLGLLT